MAIHVTASSFKIGCRGRFGTWVGRPSPIAESGAPQLRIVCREACRNACSAFRIRTTSRETLGAVNGRIGVCLGGSAERRPQGSYRVPVAVENVVRQHLSVARRHTICLGRTAYVAGGSAAAGRTPVRRASADVCTRIRGSLVRRAGGRPEVVSPRCGPRAAYRRRVRDRHS